MSKMFQEIRERIKDLNEGVEQILDKIAEYQDEISSLEDKQDAMFAELAKLDDLLDLEGKVA